MRARPACPTPLRRDLIVCGVSAVLESHMRAACSKSLASSLFVILRLAMHPISTGSPVHFALPSCLVAVMLALTSASLSFAPTVVPRAAAPRMAEQSWTDEAAMSPLVPTGLRSPGPAMRSRMRRASRSSLRSSTRSLATSIRWELASWSLR